MTQPDQPIEADDQTSRSPDEVARLAAGEPLPHDEPGKQDYVHDDPDDPEQGHE
jgi:hypothetical protein